MSDDYIEELVEKRELQEKAKDLGLPTFWGATDQWFAGVIKSKNIKNLKYGLSASIPIICRGESCPYVESCYLDGNERVVGARCPIEVGTIIQMYHMYCEQLGINLDNIDLKEHTVDLSLINELVELDIKIMRTQNKLAIDADMISDVIAEIGHKGEMYTRPEVHQAEVLAEKLRKDRHRVFEDLLSTRKSKKMASQGKDPSSRASSLMKQAMQLAKDGKIDKSLVAFLFTDEEKLPDDGNTVVDSEIIVEGE